MDIGLASLAVNLGPTELLLLLLVALPSLLVPLLVLYLVYRLGKQRGVAEAQQRMRQGVSPDR